MSEHQGLIKLADNGELAKLMGAYDKNLRMLGDKFGVRIHLRQEGLEISGPEEKCKQAEALVSQVLEIIRTGHVPSYEEFQYMVDNFQRNPADFRPFFRDEVLVTHRGKKVYPKTSGQFRYVQLIRQNELVFGIGPAGTGKTYLAVAMAVKALKEKQIDKIILTRPAIEAGERLGFLPGDLQDKVDPYLRPLYDALLEFLGLDVYQKYMEKGIIEVAPLAYMRGRTLNDAYIILDEAQNTTPEQMKMFLTRFGFGSKAIVTGDITQVDLPGDKISGLRQVIDILVDIQGIGVIMLDQSDVVRHRLVGEIVRAYAEYAEKMR